MQCAIERKNSLRDLQSQPNLGDWMFISSLGSQDFDERKFFSQISLQSLSFIIRIAKFSAYFAALCEKSEYDELWKKLYSTFGLVLTRDKPVPKSFLLMTVEKSIILIYYVALIIFIFPKKH